MFKALTWLEMRSRWSRLRELGQSNLVRASVLMPVFGYLLVLNENVHQYLTIEYELGWLSQHLPATWRVWMLYYGSSLLALGSILFISLCPREIKQYPSAISFADAERHHRTAHGTTEITQELRGLYDRMSQWEESIFPHRRLNPGQDNLGAGSVPGLSTSDQWGLGLIHIWTAYDIKWPMLRIFILALFSAGLALLAVPAAVTFLQVTGHLMSFLVS
jgi:hypothetical protein